MYILYNVDIYYVCVLHTYVVLVFFFKQKTAYEMRISDWSSDVCSSDLGVTDLARAAELNPGAMTRLLDRLEAKGLVVRTADPTDRRALNIDLTDAGLAIWQDINKCGERVRELAMAGMSDEERSVLTGLLERARDNLNSTEPDRKSTR